MLTTCWPWSLRRHGACFSSCSSRTTSPTASLAPLSLPSNGKDNRAIVNPCSDYDADDEIDASGTAQTVCGRILAVPHEVADLTEGRYSFEFVRSF